MAQTSQPPPPQIDLGDYKLRTRDLAEKSHFHPGYVAQLARTGKIPAIRVGAQWRFPADALDALISAPASDGAA